MSVSTPVPSIEPQKPSLAEPLAPLLVVAGMLAVMWAVEIIDLLPGADLDGWGIRPRTLRGLIGIPLAPFLHTGLSHLIANTIPFVVLGAVIALSGVTRFLEVTLIIVVVSGLGTWLFGTGGTIHLGASGLVFGYLTYLIARGFFAAQAVVDPRWDRRRVAVRRPALGPAAAPGISFTGHLFGAAGGVLAAFALHGKHTRENGSDLADASRPRLGP